MTSGPITDEQHRTLLAVSAAGANGTGAEVVAAQTNVSKDIVLDHFGAFVDAGLIEPVRGAVYQITDEGRRRIAEG